MCESETRGFLASRTKELFGIQLEVTALLLEAERRRLGILQDSLQVPHSESFKAQEEQQRELLQAIGRFQTQYDQLDQEYRGRALGVLRHNTGKVGDRDDPNHEKEILARKALIKTPINE
ncbi:unnamed protein product [Darwinula stevensoni]|uniref:Uncharacterized protein n=1 Tax=Darwinula stevensoni TaxID=69355 RepID=A0A7R8X963_9CRUS|nr:unnamed protein product [Darwinula stevensoni]CAG0884162.1 unnamed protein product [Darwinula stevensoni]